MTKLKIKERIEEEEIRKVKYIIIGILIILVAWIVLNIILRVPRLGKLISSIVLLIIIIYLGVEWYKAYYEKG